MATCYDFSELSNTLLKYIKTKSLSVRNHLQITIVPQQSRPGSITQYSTKGVNIFLVPIKYRKFGLGSCNFLFFYFVLIQTFLKVLVLVTTVSLSLLTDDVDDRKPHYCFHIDPEPRTSSSLLSIFQAPSRESSLFPSFQVLS